MTRVQLQILMGTYRHDNARLSPYAYRMQIKTAASIVLVTVLSFAAYKTLWITSPADHHLHTPTPPVTATIGSSGSKLGSSNMAVKVRLLAVDETG